MIDYTSPGAARDKSQPPVTFNIRSYQPADRQAVLDLCLQGLSDGPADPINGIGDLFDIEGYYLKRPQDHFWVTELGGRVIGTVGVAVLEERIAHIRRLRVAADWQDSRLAFELIKTTVDHATDEGCLKMVLHTPMDPDRAAELLGSLGFVYSGSKMAGPYRLMEFYLDLYAKPGGEARATGGPLH